MKTDRADPANLSSMERMALIRQGEAMLTQSRAKGTANADLHYQLGLIYKADSQIGEAIRHLTAANRLKKRDTQVISHLADAYVRTRDFQSARKFVRKMVELQPRDENVLLYHAEFLEKCGQYAQALTVWEKLCTLFPQSTDSLEGLASCYQTLGRWEDAEKTYRKTLAIDPTHAQTLYLIANSRKFAKDEAQELIAAIRQSLEKTGDDVFTANLHYAAGKLLTETGDNDAAMAHYHKANIFRADTGETEDHALAYKNTIGAFSRDVIARQSKNGSASTAPVFILGMPRSGTTLVESLLGAHSKIVSGGELGTINNFARRLGVRHANPDAVRDLLAKWNGGDIAKFANEYLETHGDLAEKAPHFTDKMPHNFMSVGLIRILFPQARIIHCRRHPVDNCLSLYTNSMTGFHNSYKNDLKTLGLYYRQYLQLMQHWRREVPGGFHEVYYEDVVANTELNARRMIDYLGLEWEDGVMQRENSQSAVKTLSVWQVRQPVYTTSAGRWKKFKTHLDPLIDALGGSIEAYEAELAALGQEQLA